MRVIVNGWFLSRKDTGSGQYLHALLRHLPSQSSDLDLHIVVPAASPEIAGWQLHVRTARNVPLDKLRFEQLEIPRFAGQLHADVVHIPYWAPPLRSPTPLVVTVHDIIPLLLPEHRGSLLERCYTALAAAATRGAAQIIADSHSSRQDIVSRMQLPTNRVRTVHLAAAKKFAPQVGTNPTNNLRAKYRLPESYVLYLGGFQRRKNVRHLLAAWTWAHSAMPEGYELVIAGRLPEHPDGRLFQDLPATARRHGIDETVCFIGAVDEADKPMLYQGASCFVFPSSYEGFGLPPLEAMACGVPVVTTGAASITEVVGDAAYLVSDPTDARKLGAAIISTIVDTDLANNLRERGLKQAARFSWAQTARETLRIYQLAAY
jgi:glycosyltransferase involved in cell wall biosynthesis